jgi:hypothetical protein
MWKVKNLYKVKCARNFFKHVGEPAVPLGRKPVYLSAHDALKRTLNCGKY